MLGATPTQVIHAPDARTRDAWLSRLAEHTSELWPIALVEDLYGDDESDSESWTADAAARELARGRTELARLDGWREQPDPAGGPHRLAAIRAWRERHPKGAPLASLVDAIRTAPDAAWTMPPPVELPEPAARPAVLAEDVRRIAFVPARAGHEVLALAGFGNFNACPPTFVHVACALRWERDHGARLALLGRDRYAYVVGRPPATPAEIRRADEEQRRLGADDRPDVTDRIWSFWWD
jgi:hypothetical protein